MIYDKLDLFVLIQIFEKGDTSTWEIAENFEWEDLPEKFINNKDRDLFLTSKSTKISYRLERMAEEKIVFIKRENGKRKLFVIDEDKVIIHKRHKFPDVYSKAISIKEKDDKWMTCQI